MNPGLELRRGQIEKTSFLQLSNSQRHCLDVSRSAGKLEFCRDCPNRALPVTQTPDVERHGIERVVLNSVRIVQDDIVSDALKAEVAQRSRGWNRGSGIQSRLQREALSLMVEWVIAHGDSHTSSSPKADSGQGVPSGQMLCSAD
jgi:hypothetical protein